MMTVRTGVSRGVLSNESGLGSAPIVAAAAKTANPVRQALVASSATFWDTVVVCAGQEPRRELAAALERAGTPTTLIGGADVASELDAKRAIEQGTRVALGL